MLVDPALEAGAVVATELVAEPTSTPQPLEASQVPTVVMGPLIPSLAKKKVPLAKTKGIIIGTRTVSEPFASEEEEEPILGEVDNHPPPVDIPIRG